MINATNEGGNFTPPPAGTFSARCYSMIHIGTVKETFNNESKELNKVRISWELPTELYSFKDGEPEKPFSISKEYTLSMFDRSNLRKMLEAWRGTGFTEAEAKSFDVTALIGKPCMLTIIHKTSKQGRQYADIASVTKPPKELIVPPQINPSFEFGYDPFDREKFDKLPDWMKDKIRASKEFQAASDPSHANVEADIHSDAINGDDLPW